MSNVSDSSDSDESNFIARLTKNPKLHRSGVAAYPNDCNTINAGDYKRIVGKSKHITVELNNFFESSNWKPSVPIKNFIYRSSIQITKKPTPLQNMWDFIDAITEECGLSSPIDLCYLRGITVGTKNECRDITSRLLSPQ